MRNIAGSKPAFFTGITRKGKRVFHHPYRERCVAFDLSEYNVHDGGCLALLNDDEKK